MLVLLMVELVFCLRLTGVRRGTVSVILMPQVGAF